MPEALGDFVSSSKKQLKPQMNADEHRSERVRKRGCLIHRVSRFPRPYLCLSVSICGFHFFVSSNRRIQVHLYFWVTNEDPIPISCWLDRKKRDGRFKIATERVAYAASTWKKTSV